MPPFNQIKSVCPEDSVELLLNFVVLGGLEILTKNFGQEVDHCFKEILVLEDKFIIPIAQQYPHIRISDLFAFSFKDISLVSEHLKQWVINNIVGILLVFDQCPIFILKFRESFQINICPLQ